MINLDEIYSLIGKAFQGSQDYFHWGDNAIIRGSLENLPKPERIDEFSDGDYFALVDINTVTPERAGHLELSSDIYHFSIILCRKGRTGDITGLRSTIINRFATGWDNFWMHNSHWIVDVPNIYPQVNELEKDVDILACQFVGTISHITTRGGRIDG